MHIDYILFYNTCHYELWTANASFLLVIHHLSQRYSHIQGTHFNVFSFPDCFRPPHRAQVRRGFTASTVGVRAVDLRGLLPWRGRVGWGGQRGRRTLCQTLRHFLPLLKAKASALDSGAHLKPLKVWLT